ncbi:MAG TPA: hypothetical protein VKR21_05915 [Solirubrobacteraceae bacterium]|nr:hypothetical protein [Solirubrobacteraceae bacterium]
MSVEGSDLRSVVRELLAELLQAPEEAFVAASSGQKNGNEGPRREEVITVTVPSDGDLHDVVQRVLELAEDPNRRRALRTGQIRFRLASAASHQAPRGEMDLQTLRIDRGALTEKVVAAAARDGRSIMLGPRAIATPLALDKARALGVIVRKETI